MEKRDCTNCLWEYACDWSGEECNYVEEDGSRSKRLIQSWRQHQRRSPNPRGILQ